MASDKPTLTMSPCYYCGRGIPALNLAHEVSHAHCCGLLTLYISYYCTHCAIHGPMVVIETEHTDVDNVPDVLFNSAKMKWNDLQHLIMVARHGNK